MEIHEHQVYQGDFYVLCSDGLSDMVEDDDIHLTINTFNANLDTVAKQLMQLATTMGADNVSVVWRRYSTRSRRAARHARQDLGMVRLTDEAYAWQG